MMAEVNTHVNHRERVKKKFSDFGFEGWYDHEVLEMMLFYAIPRCDTNPIAHALLNEFGTLASVLDADVEQLKKVPGIGENAAIYISALGKLQSVYNRSKWSDAKTVFSNVTSAGLFGADFIGNLFNRGGYGIGRFGKHAVHKQPEFEPFRVITPARFPFSAHFLGERRHHFIE